MSDSWSDDDKPGPYEHNPREFTDERDESELARAIQHHNHQRYLDSSRRNPRRDNYMGRPGVSGHGRSVPSASRRSTRTEKLATAAAAAAAALGGYAGNQMLNKQRRLDDMAVLKHSTKQNRAALNTLRVIKDHNKGRGFPMDRTGPHGSVKLQHLTREVDGARMQAGLAPIQVLPHPLGPPPLREGVLASYHDDGSWTYRPEVAKDVFEYAKKTEEDLKKMKKPLQKHREKQQENKKKTKQANAVQQHKEPKWKSKTNKRGKHKGRGGAKTRRSRQSRRSRR